MSSFPTSEDRPIWNYHVEILKAECTLHRTRILNLLSRWKHKAQEGLLPLPNVVGIFEALAEMVDDNLASLNFYTDRRLKRWKMRSFEDIITMTDRLRDMHAALAAAERTYWQRIEGYEAAAVDAVRNVAFSETGTMQQICNAADFLCLDLWDRIFGFDVSDWKGVVTFGHYHEFRNWLSFIFAPDYVQLFNYPMWVYFAHEVSHCAVKILRQNDEFLQIFNDLIEIFAESIPPEMMRTSESYLAEEAICDIMATLMVGESYLETLSSLKYYPPVTVFSKFKFLQRPNRYPMLLRSLVCAWTLEVCWGFDEDTPFKSGKSPSELIGMVRNEDDIEHERVAHFLGTNQKELWLKLGFYGLPPIERIYNRLSKVYDHEIAFKRYVAPSILDRIIRREIIPRLKCFVNVDFYRTEPEQCYRHFTNQHSISRNKNICLAPSDCQMSTDADNIRYKIEQKQEQDGSVLSDLTRNKLRTDRRPVEIIACLNRISAGMERSMGSKAHGHENAAIMSIFLQKRYRDRRFSELVTR